MPFFHIMHGQRPTTPQLLHLHIHMRYNRDGPKSCPHRHQQSHLHCSSTPTASRNPAMGHHLNASSSSSIAQGNSTVSKTRRNLPRATLFVPQADLPRATLLSTTLKAHRAPPFFYASKHCPLDVSLHTYPCPPPLTVEHRLLQPSESKRGSQELGFRPSTIADTQDEGRDIRIFLIGK
jgi:hypothetical protein